VTDPILERLRQDHALLRAALEPADVFLRRPASVAAEPPADARGLILELAERLGAHLAAEPGAGGPLLGGLEHDAGARAAFGALCGDHDELRSMLAALVRTIDDAPGPRRDEQVIVQLRDLVDLVRIHVRKEEVLVLAASPAASRSPDARTFRRRDG